MHLPAAVRPWAAFLIIGMSAGLKNKQLAEETGLTTNTVRSYLELLFKTIGIRSRAEVSGLVIAELLRSRVKPRQVPNTAAIIRE